MENKIKTEKDIKTIGLLISTISIMDVDKAKKLMNMVFESIRDKVKREENIEKLSWCISYVSRIDITKSIDT